MRVAAVLILLLCLAGCATDELPVFKGRRVELPDVTVSLEVPDGVSVVGRRDHPDATVYDFSSGDHVIMGLYVGFAPTFHPADSEAGVETEWVGGLPAKTRVVKTQSGWSRDIVIEAPDRRFYHFFYSDLREPELRLADHIIGSLSDGP